MANDMLWNTGMEKVFSITEAKAQFSKLLRRVAAGEEIAITKRGVPVARLVPVEAKPGKRRLGFYEGKLTIPDDFDAPLPDEILDAFEGKVKPRRKKA
jgi:prevent-host-death family protein